MATGLPCRQQKRADVSAGRQFEPFDIEHGQRAAARLGIGDDDILGDEMRLAARNPGHQAIEW